MSDRTEIGVSCFTITRDSMRIGIVCYPTFGGSGVLATELGKALADKGWERATAEDAGLAAGLNIVHGTVVHAAVAHELGLAIAA